MVGNKGQLKEIKDYLETGNTLTNSLAFKLFGCTRLGARIHNLREAGYNIQTIMCEGETRYGTTTKFAKYRMIKE